jgi:hypothetical protein
MDANTEVSGLGRFSGQVANTNGRGPIMNNATGARGRRTRVLTTAVVGAVMSTTLLTGCGFLGMGQDKGQVPGGGGQTTESRYKQAIAYAKCMRANGDPAWPDPDSNGLFANDNGSLDRTSAAYKKAAAACQDQEVSNGPNATQIEAAFQGLLKYSQCMRANGVPNFPDPKKEKGGVGIELKGDVNQNSSQYKSALNACRSLQQG